MDKTIRWAKTCTTNRVRKVQTNRTTSEVGSGRWVAPGSALKIMSELLALAGEFIDFSYSFVIFRGSCPAQQNQTIHEFTLMNTNSLASTFIMVDERNPTFVNS